LKKELEPSFRDAYLETEKEKIAELMDAIRNELRTKKNAIVLASNDEHECVEKMEGEVNEFARAFVEKDDFFKEVPEDAVMRVKHELNPEFRIAYSDMLADRLAKLKEATKVALRKFTKKDAIVLQATSEDDCVYLMKEGVDAFARAYVKKDDFFKEVPEDAVMRVKHDLNPEFRIAYNDMLADRLAKLKEATKAALRKKKDAIVYASTDDDNCVEKMGDAVDAFAVEYCGDDDFFNGIVPGAEILELKKELEPSFRDAYLETEKEKIAELMDAIRNELRTKKNAIVLASNDEHECVEKMEGEVNEFARAFVEKDDFFKEVPEDAVMRVKHELNPEFRIAYSDMLADRLAKLKEATKVALRKFTKKDAIVLQATSEDDCVYLMKEGVDAFARAYVKKDDFFKEVPEDAVMRVKHDLNPEFRIAYNDMLADRLAKLKEATKAALRKKKDAIVLQATSKDDCVYLMKEEVDEFARAYVKKDDFFKEVPNGIIPEIQDELEPEFRAAYIPMGGFDPENKSAELVISEDGRVVSGPYCNTAICRKELTEGRHKFAILAGERSWIGFAKSKSPIPYDHRSEGKEEKLGWRGHVRDGYSYCYDGDIGHNGKDHSGRRAPRINKGDIVAAEIDFNALTITYWHNGVRTWYTQKIKPGKYKAAVTMGRASTIKLLDRDEDLYQAYVYHQERLGRTIGGHYNLMKGGELLRTKNWGRDKFFKWLDQLRATELGSGFGVSKQCPGPWEFAITQEECENFWKDKFPKKK